MLGPYGAKIAKRLDTVATAIVNGMAVDAIDDPGLS